MEVTTWGSHPLADGATVSVAFGPLRLELRRAGRVLEVATAGGSAREPESRRLVCLREPDPVSFAPAVADRDVIFRPEVPHVLPAGASLAAFVTTAAWLRLEAGGAALEWPTQRLSDAWFGTPVEGRLCYASRTRLRPAADAVPGHRVCTPVTLRHAGTAELTVQRLCLPVPLLALWRAGDGTLWTDALRLGFDGDPNSATVEVVPGPPPGVVGATRVQPPRREQANNTVMRVLNSIFA